MVTQIIGPVQDHVKKRPVHVDNNPSYIWKRKLFWHFSPSFEETQTAVPARRTTTREKANWNSQDMTCMRWYYTYISSNKYYILIGGKLWNRMYDPSGLLRAKFGDLKRRSASETLCRVLSRSVSNKFFPSWERGSFLSKINKNNTCETGLVKWSIRHTRFHTAHNGNLTVVAVLYSSTRSIPLRIFGYTTKRCKALLTWSLTNYLAMKRA